MKMNEFLTEHLGIQSVVVVIFMPINLAYGALKTDDLKNYIPDPAYRSWGGFLKH